jgi:deoxyhypusine synthase
MAFLGKLKKNGSSANRVPSLASDAVLKASEPVAPGMREVDGIDFDDYVGRDITVAELIAGMTNMGFQASAVSEATRIINDMVFDLFRVMVQC